MFALAKGQAVSNFALSLLIGYALCWLFGALVVVFVYGAVLGLVHMIGLDMFAYHAAMMQHWREYLLGSLIIAPYVGYLVYGLLLP